MRKRFIGLFIVFCMLIGMLPVQVFAATSIEDGKNAENDISIVVDTPHDMDSFIFEVLKNQLIKFCETILAANRNNRIGFIYSSRNLNPETDLFYTNDLDKLKLIIEDITLSGAVETDKLLRILEEFQSRSQRQDAKSSIIYITIGMPWNTEYGVEYPYTAADFDNYEDYDSLNSVYWYMQRFKASQDVYSIGFFNFYRDDFANLCKKFLSDCQNTGYYVVMDSIDTYSTLNDILDNISNNIIGRDNPGVDNPDVDNPSTDNTSDRYSVALFREWDSERQIAYFGNNDILGIAVTDDTDKSFLDNIDKLVGNYVLVKKRHEISHDIKPDTLLDLKPVETKAGTASGCNDTSVTIDGTTYPYSKIYLDSLSPFSPPEYLDEYALYFIYNGEIVGIHGIGSLMEGTFGSWNPDTQKIEIKGQEYTLSKYAKPGTEAILAELKPGDPIYYRTGDYYLFSISRREPEYIPSTNEIAVYTTEKSLTVQVGDSMYLAFSNFSNGTLQDTWEQMALTVSDASVISLSDYIKTDMGYTVFVKGLKPGRSYITVTDTDTGKSTILPITVRDKYTKTYTYSLKNMKSYMSNELCAPSIPTNIYDVNGLYVNNYKYTEETDHYIVTFDVYNSNYHSGSVDIYDANGKWINSEEIDKYSDLTSFYDALDRSYSLVQDFTTNKFLTYEQSTFSQHTPISIEVPKGGYFTISNNFMESPGTCLFNSCDILFSIVPAILDLTTLGITQEDNKDIDIDVSYFTELLKDQIVDDATCRDKFIDAMQDSLQDICEFLFRGGAGLSTLGIYSDIADSFSDILASIDVDWKLPLKAISGAGENAFIAFSGFAGIALQSLFSAGEIDSAICQVRDIIQSCDEPYAIVSSTYDNATNQRGITVYDNGNIDQEAVLQVFKIYSDNSNDSFVDDNKDYELYNISFVKNDTTVQPNGKVTVSIPIPKGMKGDTCVIYRQESDGTWTPLLAYVEGNYLVFETDHFSLYAIVGDNKGLTVISQPKKTQYSAGDTLDVEGLVLNLGGEEITSGFICSPTVFAKEGQQTVTVYYEGNSTTFTVNVTAKSTDSGGTTTGGTTGGTTDNSHDYSTSHSITAPTTSHGKVTLSPTSASSGTKVTITTNPDNGYIIDSVIVTDKNGKEILVTETKSNTYTFTMPSTEVTVKATFKLAQVLWSNPFTDVSSDNWFYDSVAYVTQKGIMKGISDSAFAPYTTATRGMIVTMLHRMEGEPSSTTRLFSDVSSNQWFADAVSWASSVNIVNGYGDGTFGPDDLITREQLATILYRYAVYKDKSTSASANLSSFKDASSISPWAKTAIAWANKEGLVEGRSSDLLVPLDTANRAEIATIITRYCKNIAHMD